MSLGLQLIHSVLVSGSLTAWRELNASLLLENELPLYRFVEGHLARHSSLPAPEIAAEQGYSLPRIDAPPTYYLDEVRTRYAYTAVSSALPDITNLLQSRTGLRGDNVASALDIMQEVLTTTRGLTRANHASTLEEQFRAVLDDYSIAQTTVGLRGMTLGWPTLDLATNGVQGGELVVVAGRPGMGKTWVLIEMAFKAWLRGHNILFASMEMGLLQIARRWLGRLLGVNPNLIRAGTLSTWVARMMVEAADNPEAQRVKLMAGDSIRNVGDLEAAMALYCPDVVYVDAAYLLSAVSALREKGASRWEELTEVVRQLKALALRYNRPIYITVQLNRQVKKRQRRELELSDIGGTDAIPQDASLVFGMLYGNPPLELARRLLQMMKNREGELVNMLINYGFAPVNFDELPMDENGEEITDGTSWML